MKKDLVLLHSVPLNYSQILHKQIQGREKREKMICKVVILPAEGKQLTAEGLSGWRAENARWSVSSYSEHLAMSLS